MLETLVEQRLLAAETSIQDIKTALDLAQIRSEGIRVSPTVFVVPLRETRQRNQRATGPALQQTELRFALVYAVSNKSDTQGSAAKQDLDLVRKEVRDLLFGWAPTGFEAIELGNSRLVSLADMTLWWQDEFITSTLEVATQ